MEIIEIPDIEGPTAPLCWKQGPLMTRCDRRKNHKGLHVWELSARIAELEQQVTHDR